MAKLVKKKTAKSKKREVVKPEPTTVAEFIEQKLTEMMAEVEKYIEDERPLAGDYPVYDVIGGIGKIGQRYAMMSAEFPDGRAVIGYKRVYKVMLLGQTPSEAAQGRG